MNIVLDFVLIVLIVVLDDEVKRIMFIRFENHDFNDECRSNRNELVVIEPSHHLGLTFNDVKSFHR
jgi:hypothetical protein